MKQRYLNESLLQIELKYVYLQEQNLDDEQYV